MSQKRYYILSFVLCFNLIFSQVITDDNIISSNNKVKFNKKNRTDAVYLVNELIKNKISDKDKFDAIFTWVAENIKYNTNSFYLPINSGPNQIAKILKTRETICLGYAQLMDTLCLLSNIKNVTVYGYAKDEFYDVGDSIIGHNHAWNAVKLDSLWYLYDVTWSNGVTSYELTRKGKFIENILRKFPEKYKKKKIKIPRKFRKKSICGSKIEPIYYYKKRYFNTLIRNILQRITLKLNRTFFRGITTDYYLSNPTLFSATHVPDDGIWSLLNKKHVNEFEQDSLIYYLHDSMYKHQERQGINCFECDNYFDEKKQERLIILNKNSTSFNPNNKFINIYCNEELGRSMFYKSLVIDSVRLAKTDSSISYFQNALSENLIARKTFTKYINYEKNKNNTKTKLLLKDNSNHQKFAKNKINTTVLQIKKLNELLNQSSAFGTNYINHIHRLGRIRIKNNYDKLKPYSIIKINELQKSHNQKTQKLDSVMLLIAKYENAYDSIITNVSLNIWPQVFKHDSILIPFKMCITNRKHLKDNYKKIIVDLRKLIYVKESAYTNDIDFILYNPLYECFSLFNQITNTIKVKKELLNDLLKLKTELYKTKEFTKSELNEFIIFSIKETESDLCWLAINSPKETNIAYGLNQIRSKQKTLSEIIAMENTIERFRQSLINKEIKKGYKVGNNELANETKLIKKKLSELLKYKKEINDTTNFNKDRYDKTVLRINEIFRKN